MHDRLKPARLLHDGRLMTGSFMTKSWWRDRAGLLAGIFLGMAAAGLALALAPGGAQGIYTSADLRYAALLALTFVLAGCAADWLRYRNLKAEIRQAGPCAGEHARQYAQRLATLSGPEGSIGGLLSQAGRTCAQAFDAVEEAARAREDALAALVHELKTPLASLRLQVAERKSVYPLPEADLKFVNAVETELQRCETYIERGLFTSRAESFAQDYLVSECRLRSLASGAASGFVGAMLVRNIRFTIASEDVTVLTDPKWTEFIISQLLSNAVAATGEGGSIHLAARTGVEGCPARLVVENSGTGILDEDLPRIFDRGYTSVRGRNSFSEKEMPGAAAQGEPGSGPGGRRTGMGLYLASGLCRKLGHRLHAENMRAEDGSILGARFILEFPCPGSDLFPPYRSVR